MFLPASSLLTTAVRQVSSDKLGILKTEYTTLITNCDQEKKLKLTWIDTKSREFMTCFAQNANI